MNLEPPNLRIPLHRRSWAKVWLPILAGIAAWSYHRPTEIPQAAVSFFVGGAFFWLMFASGFSDRIATHRVSVVRGIWLAVVVFALVWFMRTAIPYLHALV